MALPLMHGVAEYLPAPLRPDLKRCQGETLTALRPDRIGPPPASYRCSTKPTHLAAYPESSDLTDIMSLCPQCVNTLRKRTGRDVIILQLAPAIIAAYMVGGDDACNAIFRMVGHAAVSADGMGWKWIWQGRRAR